MFERSSFALMAHALAIWTTGFAEILDQQESAGYESQCESCDPHCESMYLGAKFTLPTVFLHIPIRSKYVVV
jgi:hypothetical protein